MKLIEKKPQLPYQVDLWQTYSVDQRLFESEEEAIAFVHAEFALFPHKYNGFTVSRVICNFIPTQGETK